MNFIIIAGAILAYCICVSAFCNYWHRLISLGKGPEA